jgi:macrodomain Ter protein organizer (MatP/YcbG family)
MRINNPPKASSLMSTARSFGNYDLGAALADLIDNSITAKASQIDISFNIYDTNNVVVRIRDNGQGMSRVQLVNAMKPASTNPEDTRESSDLGRFGWGLKSASLSQARVLTVVTWHSNEFNAARWDIDNLEDWAMDIFDGNDAKSLLEGEFSNQSGTEVIWTNCDRLLDLGVSATIDERLNEKIAYAHKQLSLIFHRFLSGEASSKLVIVMQGIKLKPLDPFLSDHLATQTIDEEKIILRGKEELSVKPFIIPHFSKLSIQEKNELGGDEGLVRNQGFYVYRNKRLIIYGTWFRLMPHGELTQLMRIRVDLPNTLDTDWKITLDKSDAQLPVTLRIRLKQLLRKFGKRSINANRKKGINLNLDNSYPVWLKNIHNGRIRYLINRDHPMTCQLIEESDNPKTANVVLNMIESYMPIESMLEDRRNQNFNNVQTITEPENFEDLLDICFLSCFKQLGHHPKLAEFLSFAQKIEPFSSQWKYSESYIKEKLKEKWKLK